MKVREREEARRLRSEHGLPVNEVARRVRVSVSSVSLWVRNVPLTAEQEAVLEARNPVRNGQMRGARNNSERCRRLREAAQAHGRDVARAGERAFIAGCMLYWGEGSKRRNQACLCNTDVDMLATFVAFARRYYPAETAERATFNVNCFLNNGLSLEEIEQWWIERLGLPRSCLRAAAVNRPSSASQGKKHRLLLYGTGRFAISSTFVVQSFFGGIPEIAGMDRPEWLDL